MNRKTIIITGTSKGLGLCLAQYFIERDWLVFGCSRSDNNLIDHVNYCHKQLDLSNETDVRQWIKSIHKSHANIDSCVCNAGLVTSKLYLTLTPSSLFDEFYLSGLKATYLVCKEVSKIMIRQKHGSIINIASTTTLTSEAGTAAYTANKAAIIAMTKVLANELASTGVTCNIISPSLIEGAKSESFGVEWRELMLRKQAIKRPLDPIEVAWIVEFLSDRRSSHITGQVLNTCSI
jgi:3-oxoacyl-[acyl-carrier protein] reductase